MPDQQNCVHDHVMSSEQTLQNLEVTTEDVLNTLNDMKSSKSPGPDNIYPIILKETCPFDKTWSLPIGRQRMSPPVFKKVDRNIPVNYRPISLTSLVDKMLESIMRDKIVRYLESYSLIRDSQHGCGYKKIMFI